MSDEGKDTQEAFEGSTFTEHETVNDQARREFMKKCGKYAAFVAPAVTTLLLMEGPSNKGYTVSMSP